MVHAGHQCGSGLVTGPRIAGFEEVGTVAVRGRIGYLVAVRSSHAPELAVVPCEEVHGRRLKTVVVRACVTGTGQGGASDPFVLAVLATAVDRPECGRGRDGRRDAHR